MSSRDLRSAGMAKNAAMRVQGGLTSMREIGEQPVSGRANGFVQLLPGSRSHRRSAQIPHVRHIIDLHRLSQLHFDRACSHL
jgi:hypothetical protein